MRLIISLLIFISINTSSLAQLSISGVVTDAQTGEPITGAHVFISESQVGDYSALDGSYKLDDLTRRTFRLVISHIGYFTQVYEISNLATSQTLDITLKEDVRQLEEVEVDGKVDRKWEKYLKRFNEYFLGTNHIDTLITIENGYLVDFKDLKGRDFRVENQPILNIVNRYLGYEVEFQLSEFQASRGSSYFGYSNFRQMDDLDLMEQWEINRAQAYNGSLRHFFKAVIDNKFGENGFAATLVFEKDDRISPLTMSLISDEREPLRIEQAGPQSPNISITSIEGQYYEITFDRLLEIVFFVELDGFGDPQKSQIKLLAPLEIYPNGIIKNPQVMIIYGFLADRGVYELLPFEYEPSKD
ncbi:MAG: hypothetical protein ACJAVN_001787 [Roseivirga sp.]|jgi:hypothetical protein